MSAPAVQRRRATLFVGGLVLADLPAALASGADLVCVDLEDAVPPERKAEAREAVVAALRDVTPPPGVQVIVRVNDVRTREGTQDLQALVASGGAAGAFLLPKVGGPGDVQAAADLLDAARSDIELAAIVETAEGLEHCASVARAHPRLRSLYFGGFDLSAALGCTMAWEPLLYARSRVVHAAALAGIEAIDSPYPGTTDLDGLAADCARVRSLGMTGRCTKHVAHVAPIRRAFSATAEEIARARHIVSLFRRDPTRPLTFEGRLVELPTIRRLERVADQTPES